MAFSTDSDTSLFFPDDGSLLFADTSDTGGFASNLFSGSDFFSDQAGLVPDNEDLDFNIGIHSNSVGLGSEWLSFDDFDPSALEASCAGDGTQKFGKARRENDPMCSPKPDFSKLRLPNLGQLDLGSDNDINFALDALDDDDDYGCPKSHSQHLCCTGPGMQAFPESGIYDAVQGCGTCMCPMKTLHFYVCLGERKSD